MNLPHNHDGKLGNIRSVPNVEEFSKIADVFKLLDDSSRVRIFWLLCHCEQCVINISALLQMSSPAVSHHLRILKAYNLIESRREGKEVYYKASNSKDATILHKMIEEFVEIKCPHNEI